MDGKSVPHERDFDLTEGPILRDKEEAEVPENAELKRRIASLLKQPRMMELMERLRSMAEAVR